MKKHTDSITWLWEQMKPFQFPIFLIILFGFITSLCSVGFAMVAKTLIDSVVDHSDLKIVTYAGIFIVLILLQIVLAACNHILSVRTLGSLENRIQQTVFSRLTQTKWDSLTQYHSGDLMTRLTSDVKIVSDSLVNLVTGVITYGFHFLVAFGALFLYDKMLAITAFVLIPLLFLFSRIFGKKLKQTHLKIQEAESLCRSTQTETIQNMLILKTFQQEEQFKSKIGRLLQKRLHWQVNRAILSTIGNSILSLGYWAIYLLAFGWGALRLFKGTGSYGTLFALMHLIGQVQGPFVQLAHSYPSMISMLASASRIEELERLSLEQIDGVETSEPPLGIELDHLSFAYRENELIFRDQSLMIEPGKLVGVTGSSGEGKTTLIQLLLALHDPLEGRLFFVKPDGTKMAVSPSTRSFIAYVPQGNTLFSGTITENLQIAKHDAEEEEMIQVLKDVGAWDFVEPLPLRLETRVGEKGFGLSEGQIQRLTIARALLRKAPVLILDEATSALDIEHEKTILHTIKNLSYHPTGLIITHRQSALQICDQILQIQHPVICLA